MKDIKSVTDAASPEDKLLFISRQMDALQTEKDADALLCPYCNSITVNGQAFCCVTMAKAVKVLLDARDKVKQIQRQRAN
jgi:hypothetical protein